jgi:hypothetical protein
MVLYRGASGWFVKPAGRSDANFKGEDLMGLRKNSSTCMALGCLLAAGLFAEAVNAKPSSAAFSPATMTIYRKAAVPIVDTFPAVQSITFAGQTNVLQNKVQPIAHAMQATPKNGAIMFNLRGMPGTAGVLKLYTSSGREIYTHGLTLNAGGSCKITIPSTALGMYIVRFANGASTITQSVMSYK